MNDDIYDNGTPKYQGAQDIYDALQVMQSGEERGLMASMFLDVSWDNQDYYYIDNGDKLVERWDALTEYCNKMWVMDVAVWQMSDDDANDWIYQILYNEDLAKRIGFKKMFADIVLGGDSTRFNIAVQCFEEELSELDRFDFMGNVAALRRALDSADICNANNPYRELASAVYKKLKGMRLDEEKQLISESRAMLTAYDDFMYGLRTNQALFTQQETMYKHKVSQLNAAYESKVKALYAYADSKGIALDAATALLELKESEGNNA